MTAKEFFKSYGMKEPEGLVKKGKRVYLANNELIEFSKRIKLDYFSIGLPMGEETSKGFIPSFPLLDMLKSNNAITISNEGEWLFLCRRDVFKRNILNSEQNKEPFLVKNKRGEVLGLGRMEKSHLKPALDRGDFLRRESKKLSGLKTLYK